MSLLFGCDLPLPGLDFGASKGDIISASVEFSGFCSGWQCGVVCFGLGIAVMLWHC